MTADNLSCVICGKECGVKESFCEHHKIAYFNIHENYGYWKEAFDGLGWKDYLRMLVDNAENGIWVKEVAKYLITKDMDG